MWNDLIWGFLIKYSVRSLLKDNTSVLHQQAEDALESNSPIETSQGLAKFLNCMLQAHLQFWAECDRASQIAGLDAQSEKLIMALRNDLNIQHDDNLNPHVCNEHFSLGVGYVFEGSALGANIIRKRLLATNLRNPTYLNLVTSTAKVRWPRYVKQLDTYSDADRILSGAVVAFRYIIAQAESTQ